MRSLVLKLDALRALGAGGADALAVAALAGAAGADALQLGLREGGGPESEADARDAARAAPGFELRIAPAPSLWKAALEIRPARVVLAAESRGAPFLAAPLDLRAPGGALAGAVRALRDAGLRTGALVTPDLEAVRAAHAADLEFVDLATSALLGLAEPSRPAALERLADAARLAAKLRLEVGVAGGLSPRELPLVLEVAPVAARVTVGRAFVSRALLLGADRAVRDLRERIE